MSVQAAGMSPRDVAVLLYLAVLVGGLTAVLIAHALEARKTCRRSAEESSGLRAAFFSEAAADAGSPADRSAT